MAECKPSIATQETERSVAALIDSFLPTNKLGRPLNGKKGEVQKLLGDHVAKEKNRGVEMVNVLPIVQKHIAKEYTALEKDNERL